VKAVSLGAVAPTKENIQNRTYPLTRVVYAFLNRAPGKPVDPKVEDFLRYILSREGQRDVISEGAYLPLPQHIVAEQLRRIQ
jgi:phosphate transport system substrate-binding protein